MFDRSFPKEIEVKNELIKKIEKSFELKFPPLYKFLILNFNTSFFQFYPTINKWFKYSGLELDIYMSDKKYENILFNRINSPMRIYNDLVEYSFARDALTAFDQLAIGNFDDGYLFVGIGQTNKDVIYFHTIENEEIVPVKIESDIFKFISKYKITLPLSSVSMERGLLEKYWLNSNKKILLDMKKFEPKENEENYIELDNLVDNIYNEIMYYVQS